jgi:hypothetical protein
VLKKFVSAAPVARKCLTNGHDVSNASDILTGLKSQCDKFKKTKSIRTLTIVVDTA